MTNNRTPFGRSTGPSSGGPSTGPIKRSSTALLSGGPKTRHLLKDCQLDHLLDNNRTSIDHLLKEQHQDTYWKIINLTIYWRTNRTPIGRSSLDHRLEDQQQNTYLKIINWTIFLRTFISKPIDHLLEDKQQGIYGKISW